MSATPDQRIPQATWDAICSRCAQQSVDPYLIAAIAGHETLYGTLGDGRMPPEGSGHILGVGSYDSGSTSQWAGWAAQTDIGCNTLVSDGIHGIEDIKAGKAHVQPNGRVVWASADTQAAGFPWSAAVIDIWNSYAKTTPSHKEIDMLILTIDDAPGGSFLAGAGKTVHIPNQDIAALQAAGVPEVKVSNELIQNLTA